MLLLTSPLLRCSSTPLSLKPETLHLTPRFMDWPVASVLLGTLATLAVGILKWIPRRGADAGPPANGRIYARATDMAEIRARLSALEQAHHVLRAEIRSDMKELQATIHQAIVQR